MTIFSKPNLEFMEAREVPAMLNLSHVQMIIYPPPGDESGPISPPPASPPTGGPVVIVPPIDPWFPRG